ncbi:MAG TPA: AMP-binding protein, partial [Noviherbaspirillum sp.]|nr:AMP-binding protein [Noviherbaspirillum sp.]
MPDIIDILSLPCSSRAPNDTVGWRDGAAMTHAAFVERVRLWQALLRRTDGNRFALYLNDSIEFAAALLGAWHAGKSIYLPSDTLPASCAALRPTVDGFLGEFPADCAPLLPHETDHAADAFALLHPEFVGLMVYTSGSTG